jgi:hypothetical protein
MAHGFVLLPWRQVPLVVLRSPTARVEQEFRESDIYVSAMIAFLVVYNAAESHQRLLHLLVPVEPLLLTRPEVRNPAVRKFFPGRLRMASKWNVLIDR